MAYLYLEDGRADDDYKNGRLSEFEVQYYENFHGKGKVMIDSKINEEPPTHKELASDYHWEQLADEGATTFSSQEETRVISMDEITSWCINDLPEIGLHKATQEGLAFIYTLRAAITARRNSVMDEAIKDFYHD